LDKQEVGFRSDTIQTFPYGLGTKVPRRVEYAT